jgi:Flp pilus assembly protein TadB
VPADQVAVLLAALAGLLLPRTPRADPARLRVRRAGGPQPNRAAGAEDRPPAELGEPAVVGRRLPAWSPRALGTATVVAVLTGHGAWAAVGVVATVGTAGPALTARARRGREEAAASRELPRVADLLAACLEAGLPLTAAAAEVCAVVDPPTARRLRRLVVGLESGLPGATCGHVGGGAGDGPTHSACVDAWQRFGRAVDRAVSRGAPLAEVLVGLADDERERARWVAEEAVRRVGVRAVGPLAACFLPAFVLVGVVPVVVGVAGAVLGDLR